MKNDYDLRQRPISKLTDSELRGRIATLCKRQKELQDEVAEMERMKVALAKELGERK